MNIANILHCSIPIWLYYYLNLTTVWIKLVHIKLRTSWMHFIFRKRRVTYSSTKIWNLFNKFIRTYSFHIGQRLQSCKWNDVQQSASLRLNSRLGKDQWSVTHVYVCLICGSRSACVSWTMLFEASTTGWRSVTSVSDAFFHLPRKREKIALPCHYTNVYALTEAFGFTELYFL